MKFFDPLTSSGATSRLTFMVLVTVPKGVGWHINDPLRKNCSSVCDPLTFHLNP